GRLGVFGESGVAVVGKGGGDPIVPGGVRIVIAAFVHHDGDQRRGARTESDRVGARAGDEARVEKQCVRVVHAKIVRQCVKVVSYGDGSGGLAGINDVGR